MKVYIDGQGHMTKMASMAITNRTRTRRPMILKLGMKHEGKKL